MITRRIDHDYDGDPLIVQPWGLVWDFKWNLKTWDWLGVLWSYVDSRVERVSRDRSAESMCAAGAEKVHTELRRQRIDFWSTVMC